MDCKTGRRRIGRAELAIEVLNMRKAGATFHEIAQHFGFTDGRAHQIVTQELKRLNEERSESAQEVTRLELERLDGIFRGQWAKALKGDPAAVGSCMRIMERRAKMLGLDAAGKYDVSARVTKDSLSDAELEAIVLAAMTDDAEADDESDCSEETLSVQ